MNTDPELLVGLSDAELEALTDSVLGPSAQERLVDMLDHNVEGSLSVEEQGELDRLLAQVDHLTILKTRASYTLHQQVGARRR